MLAQLKWLTLRFPKYWWKNYIEDLYIYMYYIYIYIYKANFCHGWVSWSFCKKLSCGTNVNNCIRRYLIKANFQETGACTDPCQTSKLKFFAKSSTDIRQGSECISERYMLLAKIRCECVNGYCVVGKFSAPSYDECFLVDIFLCTPVQTIRYKTSIKDT